MTKESVLRITDNLITPFPHFKVVSIYIQTKEPRFVMETKIMGLYYILETRLFTFTLCFHFRHTDFILNT